MLPDRKPNLAALSRVRGTVLLTLGLLALLVTLPGCDLGIPGSGSGETIDDQTFVEAMVELRLATARSDGALSASVREDVLADVGVSGDDLVTFIEVHGENVPRMHDIWVELDLRLSGEGREALTDAEAAVLDTVEGAEDLPDNLRPDPDGEDQSPSGDR